MLGEGVKLMVLGMGVVFVFLTLLVVVIQINARLLRGVTAREMGEPLNLRANPRTEKRKQMAPSKEKEGQAEEKRRLVAVIAAAVATHRAKQQ
ncbi:MAG: OadG family protein [Desulfobulbus sp.]|jgi:oxaloacetate decarboxylase gamma subunit|nr:oxaloacetate decarboxylase [Desulfobulbaceae bacterium]